MLARADALIGEARRHMQSFALHLYIGAVFEVVSEANRYFANAEPWRLAKIDPARMELVLYVTVETLRIAAILLQPAMPGAWARFSIFSASRRRRAASRRSTRASAEASSTRRIGSSRAGRCRSPPRSFPVMSSRRRRSEARLPLP